MEDILKISLLKDSFSKAVDLREPSLHEGIEAVMIFSMAEITHVESPNRKRTKATTVERDCPGRES